MFKNAIIAMLAAGLTVDRLSSIAMTGREKMGLWIALVGILISVCNIIDDQLMRWRQHKQRQEALKQQIEQLGRKEINCGQRIYQKTAGNEERRTKERMGKAGKE